MVAYTTVFTQHSDMERLIQRWASAEDLRQADLKQSDKRRQEYLAGRACLRGLLRNATGRADWQFKSDAAGKPYILSNGGEPGPQISLTHTKGLICCALSMDGIVGIDAEFWRERDYTALASFGFGPKERELVIKGGAAAFYRLWTLKEAMAKAQGLSVMAVLDGTDHFTAMPSEWAEDGWQFMHCRPATNYSLSIAVRQNDRPQSFTAIELGG